jgi:anti-sigma-K factor RskA
MNTDIHTLAGAYVLDAVNDLENAAFDRHLAGCESCAFEVAELRATAARLADSTWSAPPPRLRDNVLREVARTRQVRSAKQSRPGSTVAPGQWRRRLVAAAAAAVLAAGTGAAAWVVQDNRVRSERGEIQAIRDQNAQIQAVITAADARLDHSPVKGGGRLTVMFSLSQNTAVAMLTGLDRPASNQAYQLWVMHGTTPVDAGVLPAGQAAGTQLVNGVSDGQQLAVTLEAAGGSTTPTLPVLANVSLT